MSRRFQHLVLIRGREVSGPVAAQPLEWSQHSFRGRISANRMVLQTPTSATDQQLIESQGDFKLCTEWA
jgi:hypothetical protein